MLNQAKAVATVPAEDLERATKFYTEVLGFKAEKMEGAVTFDAGQGSQIFMYQRERTKAEHTSITFMAEDLEATVDQLTERGVKFEQYDMDDFKTNAKGIATFGDTRLAWLTDTEGNILAISST